MIIHNQDYESEVVKMTQLTFALLFGNRGFFPSESIDKARISMVNAVTAAGHKAVMIESDKTKFGAVETIQEGKLFAKFLKENEEQIDGLIVSLPNFGDENGIYAAVKNWRKPIFIQAFEDKLDEMSPAKRCDAFCGKMALTDLLKQAGIRFTVAKPHVINPDRPEFQKNIRYFAAICRVVSGMKQFNIGALGARTTAFKSVRYDEATLQKYGINVETVDLSSIIEDVKTYKDTGKVVSRLKEMKEYSDFKNVPENKAELIARLSLVIDEMIERFDLNAIALRCWSELQSQLGITPCLITGMLNSRGIPTACEMDVANAVTMRMMSLASDEATCLLDWNNNYEQSENECILFHCGPVANSMLRGRGTIETQVILANTFGTENCLGSNIGKMDLFPFTYSSMKTEDGKIRLYIGEGEFVDKPVPDDYFGVYAVARISNLQDVLKYLVENGYRHHVCIAKGSYSDAVLEAATKYLGFDIVKVG